LEFDVLTDLHLRVVETFGLAFTLPADLKELYAMFGNTLGKFSRRARFSIADAGLLHRPRPMDRGGTFSLDSTMQPEP
jgi:hypothetical protein